MAAYICTIKYKIMYILIFFFLASFLRPKLHSRKQQQKRTLSTALYCKRLALPTGGLHDSAGRLRRGGGMKGWGWCSQVPFGRWRYARGREFCRGESSGALSGGYAPDSARAKGNSIVDEPGESWTPVRENLSRVSPVLHPPERLSHTHTPKPGFRGRRHAYVWPSNIAEYRSTGYGCQSCSWSAKQGHYFFPG